MWTHNCRSDRAYMRMWAEETAVYGCDEAGNILRKRSREQEMKENWLLTLVTA